MHEARNLPPVGQVADTFIPAPPPLVRQLAEAPADDPARYARAIVDDVALAVRLLRFAASSYGGIADWPTDVEEAARCLGGASTRLLVQTFCLVDAFRLEKLTLAHCRAMWVRGVLTGLIARRLASASSSAENIERLIGGLLCDVGCCVLDRAFPSHYGTLVETTPGGAALAEAERRRLPIAHPEVGRMVFLLWHMPAHMGQAVAAHHNASCLSPHDPAYPLAAAIEVAAELTELALGDDPQAAGTCAMVAAARHAGLCPLACDDLATNLTSEFEHLATLLNLPVSAADLGETETRLAAWSGEGGRHARTGLS